MIWSVHVLNMCLIMQILFWEIKEHISEKNMGFNMTSNLNKAIKQIEQASVLSNLSLTAYGHSF